MVRRASLHGRLACRARRRWGTTRLLALCPYCCIETRDVNAAPSGCRSAAIEPRLVRAAEQKTLDLFETITLDIRATYAIAARHELTPKCATIELSLIDEYSCRARASRDAALPSPLRFTAKG
eukprot:scaffold207633_cov28-Tisochrysis_lutea.AAC.5